MLEMGPFNVNNIKIISYMSFNKNRFYEVIIRSKVFVQIDCYLI